VRPLKSIGVSVGDLGNPFFVQIAKGAESEARAVGGAELKFTAVSSGYDLNAQMNQMEDFIASHVDLIILNAADTKGIAPAVRKARAAGIVVIAVDVAAAGGVDATVMSDNVQAGRLVAEFTARRLKGKGRVVILNGPSVSAVADRVAGAEEVFRRNPGIEVLSRDQNAEGNRMGGLNVMTSLLTAHPDIDAVFAINDPSALGAALALQQARRREIFVVGVDGAPDALKALRDPQSPFSATAAQDPFAMAVKAVKVGVEILHGQKPADPLILIPVTLVSRDNVGTFRGWTEK
ncbi:MAG: monosaccharide transporter substrate-binding protein family, partial [Verrucomicrobia bacterium]|nr:monosaccharide transporter substrate-binding protein family [Verrucomicrobiota bacterium]